MVQAVMWLAVGAAHAQSMELEARAEAVAQQVLVPEALELAFVDPDCGDVPERAEAIPEAAARANEGDLLIAVIDGELPSVADVLEVVEAYRIDVVALQGSACDDADTVVDELVATLSAGTVGDAWRWGLAERAVQHELEGTVLLTRGEGLIAAHRAERAEPPDLAAAGEVAPADEGIWNMFVVFAVAAVAVFVGLLYLGLRRDRKADRKA